jgi:hypothetical protein
MSVVQVYYIHIGLSFLLDYHRDNGEVEREVYICVWYHNFITRLYLNRNGAWVSICYH